MILRKTTIASTVILASALLLYTSPLAAALRSKPGCTRVKARSTAHVSRLSASTRSSSHYPAAVARHRATHGRALTARSSKPRFHGQQSIDPVRTLEIQQALIREHYLAGRRQRRMGSDHARRSHPLPERQPLADQDSSRRPRPYQVGPRPQPAESAQSGERRHRHSLSVQPRPLSAPPWAVRTRQLRTSQRSWRAQESNESAATLLGRASHVLSFSSAFLFRPLVFPLSPTGQRRDVPTPPILPLRMRNYCLKSKFAIRNDYRMRQ